MQQPLTCFPIVCLQLWEPSSSCLKLNSAASQVQDETGQHCIELLVHEGHEEALETDVKLVETTPKAKEPWFGDLFEASGNALHSASHLPLTICQYQNNPVLPGWTKGIHCHHCMSKDFIAGMASEHWDCQQMEIVNLTLLEHANADV